MGDREKVSMAGRHLYGEKQGTADVSLQRHTQRQQPSAHGDNEDWALVVKTHTGRKDDMGRGKESTGWVDSFKPVQERELTR